MSDRSCRSYLRSRRLRLACCALLWGAVAVCPIDAQAQSGDAPAAVLQGLLTAQQQAVQSGDASAIVSTSKQLAAYALRLLAVFSTQQQNPKDAEVALRQAFAIAPAVELGLQLLGLQLQAGESDAALATRKALIALAGESSPIYLALGNAYQQAGDLDDAIEAVSQGVALAPESAVAHLALGTLYWTLNDQQYNPDSLREFRAAYRLDPRNFLDQLNLGTILSEYHVYAEAEEYLEQAIAANGSAVDPRMQLGMDLYAQHDLAKAQAELEEAVRLARAHDASQVASQDASQDVSKRQLSRALFVLSRIAAEEQRQSDADRLSAQADALHQDVVRESRGTMLSESIGSEANMAVGLNRSNTAPGATGRRAPVSPIPQELASQLRQITAQSLNDAGTSLARQREYEASLPLFKEAAAIEPGLVPVMRNLGLAAFHTGDWSLAAQALGAALKQDPSDALVRQDLDEALQKSGAVERESPQ